MVEREDREEAVIKKELYEIRSEYYDLTLIGLLRLSTLGQKEKRLRNFPIRQWLHYYNDALAP